MRENALKSKIDKRDNNINVQHNSYAKTKFIEENILSRNRV